MATLTPTPYATQIANPGGARDARYSLQGLQKLSNGTYTDGYYTYDSSGRGINRPNSVVSGLPPANASESYNVNTGQYSLGALGGGGGGASFGPEFDQMMQDLRAQSVSDKASRDAAIQRSYINFGLGGIDLAKAGATTGIGDLASVLDPTTQQLAANNQFSVQKRLDQALADQKTQDRVALRQRGAVRSGEAGYAAQNTQRAYDTNEYDATQKLLDYITGAQQGFVQAERARQMQMWQLALAAAQAGGYGGYGGYGGEPAPAAAAAPSAPTVPGFSLPTGGSPLIRTGGGYYTDKNGNMTAKWQKLAGI